MSQKKLAIYVEGQSEQILLNHLIKTWWSYSGIKITNIKVLAEKDISSPVPDFIPSPDVEIDIIFLIINVEGAGSLTSVIAGRANKQIEIGYQIIGLRDLFYPEDNLLNHTNSEVLLAKKITNEFQKALKIKLCKSPEKIYIYFAVMEIEAWILAFSTAVSKWARLTESDVQKIIYSKHQHIESIKKPSVILKQIGESGNRKKSQKAKSFDAITSISHVITKDDIFNVLEANKVPSFNKFWNEFLSLCEATNKSAT